MNGGWRARGWVGHGTVFSSKIWLTLFLILIFSILVRNVRFNGVTVQNSTTVKIPPPHKKYNRGVFYLYMIRVNNIYLIMPSKERRSRLLRSDVLDIDIILIPWY